MVNYHGACGTGGSDLVGACHHRWRSRLRVLFGADLSPEQEQSAQAIFPYCSSS